MRKFLAFISMLALSHAINNLLVVGGVVVAPILASLLKLDQVMGLVGAQATQYLINASTGMCNHQGLGLGYSYIGMAYIAAVGVFLFMVVLHMVEKLLFGTSRIPLLVKAEDAITTVLIVTVFLFLFSLFGGTQYYFLESSMEYVDKGIAILTNSYARLVFANFIFATLFNIDIPLLKRGGMIALAVNTGFVSKPLTDSVMLLANMMQTSLTEWVVRRITLCLIPPLTLLYLLPIGALLRGLYFTRGAGSAMLALAFSLYFFYPFLNFISYQIFQATHYFMNAHLISPAVDDLAEVAGYLIVTMGLIWGFTFAINYVASVLPSLAKAVGINLKGTVQSILSLPTRLTGHVYLLALVAFMVGMVMGFLPALFRDLFIFIVAYGIVLPAVNIYLTLVMAIELSKSFGMQVDLSAFMRLI